MNQPNSYLPVPQQSGPAPRSMDYIPPMDDADGRGSSVAHGELLHYWDALVARKRTLLLLGAISALVTAAYVSTMPSIYRSTVSVLVEAGKPKVLSIEDLRQTGDPREFFQAQVEIMQSRSVAEGTVRALRLWENEEFNPRLGKQGILSTIKSWLFIRSSARTNAQEIQDATDALIDATKVESIRASQLIKVSVDSRDPKQAALIANTMAERYMLADREARMSQAQQVSTMLQERLKSLRDNLARSEKELQAYREKQGLVNVGGASTHALSREELAMVTERLTTARARRAEMEGMAQQVKRMGAGDYQGIAAVQRDPSVNQAQLRLNELKTRLAEVEQKYGSAHFTTRELHAQVAQAQSTLAQMQRSVVSGIVTDYEAARATEREIEAQLQAARTAAQTVNRDEFQLTALQREVDSNRQMYEMFLNREKETRMSAEVQAAVAHIIDPAIQSKDPYGPKRLQLVLLAAVLSTSLGAFFLLLRMALDRTLKGADDAELRINLPVLSALPMVDDAERELLGRVFIDRPQSAYAEAIRTARTGILMSSLDKENKVILVTSSIPGEGKTTVAVNLALAHAMTHRTLLVDADMRRPQVAKVLGLPPNAHGLTNLTSGISPAAACIHRVEGSDLCVIPAGELPPNPLELLLSQRAHETLKALQTQFDVIIIDSPPLESVSDAQVLALSATSTVFVAKASTTPYPMIRKNVAKLQRAKASVLGLILNQVDFSSLHRSAYSYSTPVEKLPAPETPRLGRLSASRNS